MDVGGKRVIRRAGAEHDAIDVAALEAGILQRLARGGDREVGGQFPFRRDVALADAGALADPFVGGVDGLGQLVIGHDTGRQIGSGAEDSGTCDHMD